MEHIMKILKSLEESAILWKGLTKIIEKVKRKRDGFRGMFLGTLGNIALQKILAGKGGIRTDEGKLTVGENLWCPFIL